MHRGKASYIIEILIHAVFWMIVYFALKALIASSFQMLVSDKRNVLSQDGKMLFPYAWIVLCFLMLLFYTASFWLFRKANHYRLWLIACALIAFYVLNFFVIRQLAASTRLVAHHPDAIMPGPPPVVHLETFSATNWWDMQPVIALLFILVLGIAAAYFYIGESIRNELLRSQSEAHHLSTELKFLRSQINPHFLFNTLNNLFSMAQREGKENLADKIAKLSGMMRYMLYDSNADKVPLENEIACLEDCIALHQMRYVGNLVEISFYYPDSAAVDPIQLAPMLLIPFLENAFKHGVVTGRQCYIAMEISIDQKRFTFTCQNMDHSAIKKIEAEKGGIGLENVRRRLELVYPGRHKLLAGPENGKYMVNLQIDL